MCDPPLGTARVHGYRRLSCGLSNLTLLGLIITNNQKRKNSTVSVRGMWRKI